MSMTEYIKDCPRCLHANPEEAFVCEACGEFLGAVQPREAEAPPPVEPVDDGIVPPASDSGETTRATRPQGGEALLYLEMLDTGDCYRIEHGNLLGQEYPGNPAQVQIGQLPNSDRIRLIHRRHCRFEFESERWWITPLDQRAFGSDFTNTTDLNERRLHPDRRHPLNDGDRLELAGVVFTVRIA